MPNPAEQNDNYAPDSESEGGLVGFLKSILIFIILVLLIVGSFWLSYVMGKRILMPVKQPPKARVEITVPEAPPSIAHLQKLEKKINQEALVVPTVPVTTPTSQTTRKLDVQLGHFYQVQAGFFRNSSNAANLVAALNKQGFSASQSQTSRGTRVLLGAFNSKAEARTLRNQLKNKGFESIIIFE